MRQKLLHPSRVCNIKGPCRFQTPCWWSAWRLPPPWWWCAAPKRRIPKPKPGRVSLRGLTGSEPSPARRWFERPKPPLRPGLHAWRRRRPGPASPTCRLLRRGSVQASLRFIRSSRNYTPGPSLPSSARFPRHPPEPANLAVKSRPRHRRFFTSRRNHPRLRPSKTARRTPSLKPKPRKPRPEPRLRLRRPAKLELGRRRPGKRRLRRRGHNSGFLSRPRPRSPNRLRLRPRLNPKPARPRNRLPKPRTARRRQGLIGPKELPGLKPTRAPKPTSGLRPKKAAKRKRLCLPKARTRLCLPKARPPSHPSWLRPCPFPWGNNRSSATCSANTKLMKSRPSNITSSARRF